MPSEPRLGQATGEKDGERDSKCNETRSRPLMIVGVGAIANCGCTDLSVAWSGFVARKPKSLDRILDLTCGLDVVEITKSLPRTRDAPKLDVSEQLG